jgi:2-polyprenyl-3-methyl-5-hydroxy-6-metoxy-1,4-benzoquinol methylase
MVEFKKVQNKLGYIEASPKPTPDELKKFYSEKYFQDSVSTFYAKTYSDEEKKWFECAPKVSEFIWQKTTERTTGLLCDVGCGEGFFSNYFHKQGWSVDAFDFSKFGVQSQNPDLLPSFTQGDVYQILDEKIKNAKSEYDLINLANVLEHVVDPHDLLLRLKALASKKSLIRICVPNDFSAYQDFLVKNNFTEETWFLPPEHLNYFNCETIKKLVTSVGFKIEHFMTTFPVEFFLANPSSNYWQDPALGKGAHSARIKIENFLLDQGVDKYVDYYKASAEIGVGRAIVLFLSI